MYYKKGQKRKKALDKSRIGCYNTKAVMDWQPSMGV